MSDAPERMFVREKPNGAMGRWHDATSLPETAAMTLDGSNPMRPYILATPEALANSPEVQALIAAAETRVNIDPLEIEAAGKRWHGEDHRIVSVRWEPYKPDGVRQMKAKGRWQEMVGSGDYWRWQNCERPAAIHTLKKGE